MSVQVPTESGSEGGGRGRRRGPALAVLVLFVVVLTAVSLASAGVRSGAKSSAPAKGGTLVLLGQSDIFNLDTTSGYYTVDNILERAFTRQLVSYPNSPSFLAQIAARARRRRPSCRRQANGGISCRREDLHAAHQAGRQVGHDARRGR